MLNAFVNSRCARYALMLLICYTSPAGGTKSGSSVGTSLSPLYSTMYDINWINEPKPTPQTVNHRLLCTALFVSAFSFGREIPAGQTISNVFIRSGCPIGYGRSHR